MTDKTKILRVATQIEEQAREIRELLQNAPEDTDLFLGIYRLIRNVSELIQLIE